MKSFQTMVRVAVIICCLSPWVFGQPPVTNGDTPATRKNVESTAIQLEKKRNRGGTDCTRSGIQLVLFGGYNCEGLRIWGVTSSN